MSSDIEIFLSPCPNDTFAFFALLNKRINTEGLNFKAVFEDIETLNRLALQGKMKLGKVSFQTYAKLSNQYHLLDSGSALGFDCGPLLIAKRSDALKANSNPKIALPGENTTATFLFKYLYPQYSNCYFTNFACIEDAVASGEADAGVIIHENRFTYEKKGLIKLADLGSLWFSKTNLAIPLGGIVAARSYETTLLKRLDCMLKESIRWAWEYVDDALDYCSHYAQNMGYEVMMQHIRLYVNDFTYSLGKEGKKHIEGFIEKVGEVGGGSNGDVKVSIISCET